MEGFLVVWRGFWWYGDAAATLKLGHLVKPGPFLSDAAAAHTNETPLGHWDTLPPPVGGHGGYAWA